MNLVQVFKENVPQLGMRLARSGLVTCRGTSTIPVSRLGRRPRRRIKTNASPMVFSRGESTSAAVAVAEDVYAPPVSYPASARRKVPRDGRDSEPPRAQARAEPMSYSWVGLTGGQIFRDMMRRHNVKHICESCVISGKNFRRELTWLQLDIRAER